MVFVCKIKKIKKVIGSNSPGRKFGGWGKNDIAGGKSKRFIVRANGLPIA